MRVKRVMKFKILITICLSFVVGGFVMADNTHYGDLELSNSESWSITDASQTGLDITSDFTFEAWVNFESTTADGTLFSKFLSGDPDRAYECQMKSGRTTIECAISPDGTSASQTTVSLSWAPDLATWYHIAIVYDASEGEIELFVNGSSQDVETGLATSIADVSSPFYLGRLGWSTGYFDGQMDEVRMWNDVRTGTEIGDYDDCGLVGDEDGLISLWKFDNDATDENANANDLTENNTPTYSASGLPFTADCEVGGGGATTSTSTIQASVMPIENDIGVITSYTEIYTDSTTTPSEIRKTYYHIPFFVWLLMWLVVSFIFQRVYSLLTKNEKK